MSITNLSAEREKRQPHIQGPAVCLGCQHEQHIVKPASAPAESECNRCGLMKVVFTGLVKPAEGALHWTCNCGSIRFMALTQSELVLLCEGCGREHRADEMVVR